MLLSDPLAVTNEINRHAPAKAKALASRSNPLKARFGAQKVSEPIARRIQLNGSLGAAKPSPTLWKLAPVFEKSCNQLSLSGRANPPVTLSPTGMNCQEIATRANIHQSPPLAAKPKFGRSGVAEDPKLSSFNFCSAYSNASRALAFTCSRVANS